MKKQILTAVALAGSFATPAMAVDLTANAGLVTEYVFRGVPLSDGKSAAQGGVDAAFDSGFYVGTWGSSVKTPLDSGVEVDLYLGWGGETGDFNYGVGGTYYTYSEVLDEDYVELNLSGGWKWLTLDIALGEYDTEPTQDYTFVSLTGEVGNGVYATVGGFGQDFDGYYFEAGYGDTLTVADTDLFDYSISYIYSDSDLPTLTDRENTLVFGIVKNFDIK